MALVRNLHYNIDNAEIPLETYLSLVSKFYNFRESEAAISPTAEGIINPRIHYDPLRPSSEASCFNELKNNKFETGYRKVQIHKFSKHEVRTGFGKNNNYFFVT